MKSSRRSLTYSASILVVGCLATCRSPLFEKRSLGPSEIDPPVEVTSVASRRTLEDVAAGISGCKVGCDGFVYIWSKHMPLSRMGVRNVIAVAEDMNVDLHILTDNDLRDYARRRFTAESEGAPFADAVIGADALIHAPALLVHRGGELLGPAILGFKTSDAYQHIVEQRFAHGSAIESQPARLDPLPRAVDNAEIRIPTTGREYHTVGFPGYYFRSVPGRQALAYESGGVIYLLDLRDGRSHAATGHVDFIPTPDGEYFVTPGPTGLLFYSADDVFETAMDARGDDAAPILNDREMTDQYPSVGFLASGASWRRYRVLTSWFDDVAFRDYEIRVEASGKHAVRPLGAPVRPCAGLSLSTPIISPNGTEVAARDEASGTTKIFRLLGEHPERCREVMDFGVATSKVAWTSDSHRVAFTVLRFRSETGLEGGIYIYDRGVRRLTHMTETDGASYLAFPDFIGDESLVFLVPGSSLEHGSAFRVVDIPQ